MYILQQNKRGFTLVELSIVLVIIGLLIGGILVAQSMIGATKAQSFVRHVQQFDIAVQNFQTKYNGLPGDVISFGGNGDGKIITNNESFDGETANFWPILQMSGFTFQGKIFNATLVGGI